MNWEFSVWAGKSKLEGEISLSTLELQTLLFQEMVELHFFFDDMDKEERNMYVELWYKDHGLKTKTDEKKQTTFNLFIDGAENCCEFIEHFMGITGVTFGRQRPAICDDMQRIRFTEYADHEGNDIKLADRIKEFPYRGRSSEYL